MFSSLSSNTYKREKDNEIDKIGHIILSTLLSQLHFCKKKHLKFHDFQN